MINLALAENVPVSTLRKDLYNASETKRPLVLTRRGKQVSVLVPYLTMVEILSCIDPSLKLD